MSVPAAFITGSSRGIGRAAAIALADAGFSIALNAPTDDEIADAAQELTDRGANVCRCTFDVSNTTAHNAALDAAEDALGPLTTLVNNAGVGVMRRGDPLDVSEASWDRCLTINAKAMFFLTQAFAKRLLERERNLDLLHSIINVTSSNASAVAVPRSEYCASKAAAAMVSKTWAARLGAENIAVYDVRPGLIATDMTAPVIAEYEERARDGLTLFPRVGTPKEVGAVIATLATGGLPYTTGQAVAVDGGMLVPRF